VPGRDPTPEAGPQVMGAGLGSVLSSGSWATAATLAAAVAPAASGQPVICVLWFAAGGVNGECAWM
jgi:hypothetical protein